MDNEQIVAIIHEFLLLSLILVAPTVATSLIVGLLISLLQTVTSIQEQTMTFAPRILAVAAVGSLTLSWTLNLLIDFSQRLFQQISQVAT